MLQNSKGTPLSPCQKGMPSISEKAPSAQFFNNIEDVILTFQSPHFTHLNLRERFSEINQTLCKLIQNVSGPAFLLSAVLDFFDRINHGKFLKEPLNLVSFEFWLNHFSGISEQENFEIRAKIVGKYFDRDEYQVFFPVGMEKVYFGTHFVAAHLSPDIDTMIASFWDGQMLLERVLVRAYMSGACQVVLPILL